MKILRYNYKNSIKTGLIVEDNKIIAIENLKFNAQEKIDVDDQYIIDHKLYNVEPIFIITLINKRIITK